MASFFWSKFFPVTPPDSGSDRSDKETEAEIQSDNRGLSKIPSKKHKNKCLSSTSGPLNIIYGSNVSIEEVGPMEDSALVENIPGRNPSLEDMGIWVKCSQL